MESANIPNDHILYRYVKPEALPNGQSEIPPGISMDGELSCDWEDMMADKPEQSPHISLGKTVIVAITVCDEIRNPCNPKNSGKVEPSWTQQIIHKPEEDNIAHSLIAGKKKLPIVDAIARNSKFYTY
jgi:hypothetical protein